MLNRARPFLNMASVITLLASGNWKDSTLVEKMQNKFANTIGAPYALAINQGRSALLIALKSLKIGSGDEVIVQSLICQVVIDSILEVGARVVLVDSMPDDYQVSPDEIKRKITSKTKAVIAAHLYGIPCQIKEILDITIQNGCYLIEDCAHSLGAEYDGKQVGTYGDMAYFSFNFDKPLSIGNGGMLVVNNAALMNNVEEVLEQYERTDLQEEKNITYGFLLQHLLTETDVYRQFLPTTFGESLIRSDPLLFSIFDNALESHLSEPELRRQILSYLEVNEVFSQEVYQSLFHRLFSKLKAASKRFCRLSMLQPQKIDRVDLLMNSLRAQVCLEQLNYQSQVSQVRNRNAAFLAEMLNEDLYRLPKMRAETSSAFLRYTVLNQTRLSVSEISKLAQEKGFEISNYNWPKTIHLISPYHRILQYDRNSLKNSERIASQLLNLPVHYYVRENELECLTTVLNNFER